MNSERKLTGWVDKISIKFVKFKFDHLYQKEVLVVCLYCGKDQYMNQTSTFGSNLNLKFSVNGDTVNDKLP